MFDHGHCIVCDDRHSPVCDRGHYLVSDDRRRPAMGATFPHPITVGSTTSRFGVGLVGVRTDVGRRARPDGGCGDIVWF